MSSSSKADLLQIHIVEDHNDALRPIYRGIATKILPYNDNLLLHFDSHPDLLIPKDLTKAEVYDKEELFLKISIENWIMPAVFANHIKTIIWMKPPWADQILDGSYEFSIGIDPKSGTIKVSCADHYFVSEVLYCDVNALEEKKNITLHVITLGDIPGIKRAVNEGSDPDAMYRLVKKTIDQHNGKYILDVDLDFFATVNPFHLMFKEADMYDRLKPLYHFEMNASEDGNVEDDQNRRKLQLENLSKIFLSLPNFDKTDKVTEMLESVLDAIKDEDHREKIRLLVKDIVDKFSEEELDWSLVHDAGCTWDTVDREIPHHDSSDEEVESLMTDVKEFLKGLPRPSFITVARSSLDNYCPPSKVDNIQELLYTNFRAIYDSLDKVTYHY